MSASAENLSHSRNMCLWERSLLLGILLLIAFTSVVFGGYLLWAQIGYSSVSLACFLTLWVRRSDGEWPIARLVRWPVSWIGFGFLIYLCIGALNPAAELLSTKYPWPVRPLTYIHALPATLSTPFHPISSWSVIVCYSAVWMAMCSVWAGLHAKALRIVLRFFVFWGSALALIAILQRLIRTYKLFWIFDWPYPEYKWAFYGTFLNRNHMADYLCLVLGGVLALTLFRCRRGWFIQGVRFLGYIVLVGLIGVAVGLSFSRGGALGAGCIVCGIFVVCAVRVLKRWGLYWSILSAVLLLCAGGAVVEYSDRSDYFIILESRLERLGAELAIESARSGVRAETWKMFTDMPAYGWGAGSFRYVFRHYQHLSERDKVRFPYGGTRWGRWHEAHNDWVQFLAEYGLVGAAFLLTFFGWMLRWIWRYRRGLMGPSFMIYVAIGMLGAIAYFDFPFQNPVLLLTTGILLTLALRYQAYMADPATDSEAQS